MKRTIILSLVFAAGVFFLMGKPYAEEATGKPEASKSADSQAKKDDSKDSKKQINCPIMGGKVDEVDRKLFVDYKGKRIFVCCTRCLAVVKADPEKYIKEMEAKGIILDETPKDKATEALKVDKKEDGHAGHQH
ncbi:MAG TPA: hypothetical protein DET40_24530 [Lentisphaeria bacterium]|nr:MAG: hypothetical protein A2X45_22965 [Lentisphaerae bacterium GWF2_50_93]HCE46726.1 hypothetical protein [Lentisphaeria bacterium]